MKSDGDYWAFLSPEGYYSPDFCILQISVAAVYEVSQYETIVIDL